MKRYNFNIINNSDLNFGGNIPDGFDIGNSIKMAEEIRNNSKCKKEILIRFKELVDYGSSWDLKAQAGDYQKYQNFGNFHYGFIGTVLGLDASTLLSGAGGAQKANYNNNKREKLYKFLKSYGLNVDQY